MNSPGRPNEIDPLISREDRDTLRKYLYSSCNPKNARLVYLCEGRFGSLGIINAL